MVRRSDLREIAKFGGLKGAGAWGMFFIAGSLDGSFCFRSPQQLLARFSFLYCSLYLGLF